MSEYLHTIEQDIANRVAGWFRERGGILVWRSADLSNPGRLATGPLTNEDGSLVARKPFWWCQEQGEPITDPSQVGVVTYKEVKRFHVSLRRSSNGLSMKLTDASNSRLDKALANAGDGAAYMFDYSTQEAVVLLPAETKSLAEVMNDQA